MPVIFFEQKVADKSESIKTGLYALPACFLVFNIKCRKRNAFYLKQKGPIISFFIPFASVGKILLLSIYKLIICFLLLLFVFKNSLLVLKMQITDGQCRQTYQLIFKGLIFQLEYRGSVVFAAPVGFRHAHEFKFMDEKRAKRLPG